MEKIFIWWVQWVWKSTIIKEICNNTDTIWMFSYWEEMTNIAKKEFPNYKKFDYLSDKQRSLIVNIVKYKLDEILDKWKYEKLLFDNHYTIIRNWIIKDAFTDDDILFYNKLSIITSDSTNINTRILLDKNKERADLASDIDLIKKHQKKELNRMIYLWNKFDIDLIKITNNSGINIPVSELENFILKR